MERREIEAQKRNGKDIGGSMRARQCMREGISGKEALREQVEFFMRDTQFVGEYKFTYKGVNERDAVLLDIGVTHHGVPVVLVKECPVGEETLVIVRDDGKKIGISPRASEPKSVEIRVSDL